MKGRPTEAETMGRILCSLPVSSLILSPYPAPPSLFPSVSPHDRVPEAERDEVRRHDERTE